MLRFVKQRSGWGVLVLLAAALAGIAWWGKPSAPASTEPIGLFTTLPILWSESPDLAAELNPDSQPHWARAVLSRAGRIEPLDLLAGPAGHGPLDRLKHLVLAQPRVLSGAENVALDAWVRGGGQLLLIGDPALTAHSDFPLGDPRRPQAVALLSPILSHWGLGLRFDDAQQLGEGSREVMGVAVPVNLPGHFVTEGQANCKLWGEGLAVTCTIGRGRVVALADAALLERDDPVGTRAKALAWLLDAAFVAR
jgi:hypothetical protein